MQCRNLNELLPFNEYVLESSHTIFWGFPRAFSRPRVNNIFFYKAEYCQCADKHIMDDYFLWYCDTMWRPYHLAVTGETT